MLYFIGKAVRREVFRLSKEFMSLDDAEAEFGLDLDFYSYNDRSREEDVLGKPVTLSVLTPKQKLELLISLFKTLDLEKKAECFERMFADSSNSEFAEQSVLDQVKTILKKVQSAKLVDLMDELYLLQATRNGITTNPGNFVTISIKAMSRLQSSSKTNLVYKFSEMLVAQKENMKPVLDLDRMPFGLLDYTIQFFTCSHVKQVILVFVPWNGLSKLADL